MEVAPLNKRNLTKKFGKVFHNFKRYLCYNFPEEVFVLRLSPIRNTIEKQTAKKESIFYQEFSLRLHTIGLK